MSLIEMSSFTGVAIESDSDAPTHAERARFPWRYIGYKDFTAFAASDDDLFAVRRFGRLHIRALLTLQDQVADLESQLDAIDNFYSQKNVHAFNKNPPQVMQLANPDPEAYPLLRPINNGTIRDDMPERASLVSQITVKLQEYDDLLLKYITLKSKKAASQRHVDNIKSWFVDFPGAISKEETDFINHPDDLVCVSAATSPARRLFATKVVCKTKAALNLFRKRPHRLVSAADAEYLQVYDDGTIDTWASVAAFAAAAFMLITPLWILQGVQDPNQKLSVISVFVFLCLLFLTYVTLGKPFERLAATAGYAAVLVVFLQLGNTAGPAAVHS